MKRLLLCQASAFVAHGETYNNNKFPISEPTWNDEFELPEDRFLCQIFKIILNIS